MHRANRSFNQDIEGRSVFDVLGRINNVKIVDNSSVKLDLKNIELISPTEGIECNILKLGNSEWQTGKLRINVMFRNDLDLNVGVVKLEFCYGEPPQQESPLDDIRQREDYQQLLNNQ
ncbi:MAG: hypothetical protein F6K22_36985 [Okeania sp. SIO2F4]|uniref:KGK domain-containing protein n=1 Tax=Okeania sp. SIO2F4 TaxID=2607790 RepID=UPI001429A122|nr:KGK domain-containing protein [Okeania sp. SIO2F4]NES07897.1 hypothetical protein [Okeania sp. SIO2F4]